MVKQRIGFVIALWPCIARTYAIETSQASLAKLEGLYNAVVVVRLAVMLVEQGACDCETCVTEK